MSRKVAVTEKMRKELRERIEELTPKYKWYTIARCERESVKWAYMRVDKVHDVAETFSDDGVTSMIYEISAAQQRRAKKTIQWLEENNLWQGAKFNVPEEASDQ